MFPLRSLNHNEPAYVQFQNKSERDVDIIWINYRGDFQKYVTLKPSENINIDTYATHPWLFVDCRTGIKMEVGSRAIFYPMPNSELARRLGLNNQQNFRVPIEIKLPLFTLRQISLQSVLSQLRNLSDIDALQLPNTIKRDLRRLGQEKENTFSKYE